MESAASQPVVVVTRSALPGPRRHLCLEVVIEDDDLVAPFLRSEPLALSSLVEHSASPLLIVGCRGSTRLLERPCILCPALSKTISTRGNDPARQSIIHLLQIGIAEHGCKAAQFSTIEFSRPCTCRTNGHLNFGC